MPPRPQRRSKERESHLPQTHQELIKSRLYGELTSPEELEEEEKRMEDERKKKQSNFYLKLCDSIQAGIDKKTKKSYVTPTDLEEQGKKKKKEKVLPKEYREAFDFLGWKVSDEAAIGAPNKAFIYGLVIGIVVFIGGFMILRPSDMLILFSLFFAPVFCALGFRVWIEKYPISMANTEKLKALTYVPEIITYLIMEMRLQPNLERAVEFASEHGQGKIAEDLEEILWKNRIGVYEGIEEGLDVLAYRWEPYSEEFKHAVTMIRASVLIPSDIERNLLFDKVIEDVLDSTKEKMELYTRSMKQPSMYLFYIAVLLPLMIIIMLPVAAAFIGLPVASPEILIILYVFLLPMITYMYAKSVLSKRPGGYVPPVIPDDHPGLPKKGWMVWKGMKLPILATAILVFIILVGAGWWLESLTRLSPGEIEYMEEQGLTVRQQHYYQYLIPLAIAIPLAIYLYGNSVHKRSAQKKIEAMERDFKDAIYLMASRLGEKKPLEDAIAYVKRFMPESEVATTILDMMLRNIMVLGLTIKSAIFDPTYGALKNVPSRLMASSFKIMIDSIELGPQVASTSLISVSNQIRNIQKINDLMKKLLGDITSMMSSMATFIAPVVLGIVASLQSVIQGIIEPLGNCEEVELSAGLSGEEFSEAASMISGKSGMISCEAIKSMASPDVFQIIVGIYVIELVFILAYFSAKIQFGDNKTAVMLGIGKSLPIAILVFVGSLFAAASMMGGLMGV
ncbi:MAG: hypothetical protein JXB14_02895 [Candidatus Altiarchaeota archaeon]|nr:hypothetical protein [Candidatus Altiarchaeota archaeon]